MHEYTRMIARAKAAEERAKGLFTAHPSNTFLALVARECAFEARSIWLRIDEADEDTFGTDEIPALKSRLRMVHGVLNVIDEEM